MSEAVTLQTFTLELVGPRNRWDHGQPIPLGFAAHVRETEENLTDLLPPGFSVVIREWDEEGNPQ